jgi:GH43 family beta-xylosidase
MRFFIEGKCYIYLMAHATRNETKQLFQMIATKTKPEDIAVIMGRGVILKGILYLLGSNFIYKVVKIIDNIDNSNA